MTLIIQSAGDSIRTAESPLATRLTVPVPPALTAGDMLVVAVASASTDALSVAPVKSGTTTLLTFTGDQFSSAAGRVGVFSAPVITSAHADAIRAVGTLTVGTAVSRELPATVHVFRVTGADIRRFVESAAATSGNLAADGELAIPSFDPEHRTDNTILYLAAASFRQDATTPVVTVGGSTPVGTLTAAPDMVTDGAKGLTTSLSIRGLASADPTGTTRISYSAQPAEGMGMAVLLRSENRPPVINLAESWAAEVGREAVISATITDPDQTPVSYVWSQLSGPETVSIGNVYARAFTFTPTKPGIYRFVLSATDIDGGTTSLETSVVVPAGATGPAEVLAAAGWTDQDGGSVDAVELADGSDATFARTVDLPAGKPLTLRLNPIYGGAAVTVTVRGAASNPSPSLRRTLTLRQSDGTLIAERSYALPTTMQSYVFTTTRNETALITNRSALSLTIVDEVA